MLYPSVVRTIVAGILACAWMSANAEVVYTTNELPNKKRTVGYMYSRDMQAWLYRLGVEQDRKFGIQQDCRTPYRIEPYSVSILQPIDFPDDKQHPVKGVWNFRYQLQRCGDSKIYNAIFVAGAGGDAPPTPRAYYPGTTSASLVLVQDTMRSALSSATVKANLPDCKDVDVFDMRVTQPPREVVQGEKTFKGVWNEIWTFRLCGRTIDVGISFIPHPNGDGTQYVIDPVKPSDGAKNQ